MRQFIFESISVKTCRAKPNLGLAERSAVSKDSYTCDRTAGSPYNLVIEFGVRIRMMMNWFRINSISGFADSRLIVGLNCIINSQFMFWIKNYWHLCDWSAKHFAHKINVWSAVLRVIGFVSVVEASRNASVATTNTNKIMDESYAKQPCRL